MVLVMVVVISVSQHEKPRTTKEGKQRDKQPRWSIPLERKSASCTKEDVHGDLPFTQESFIELCFGAL
jgi:hypothetical protein